MTAAGDFSARLVVWHEQHGRHDLPWQRTRNPYRVWLSEIMLQQTQVAAVIPYYLRFLERFPNLATLAAAPVAEVMVLWSGLGYYARARNAHACARVVMQAYGGRFPPDAALIAQLPGIGPSTANAIAAFCFGIPAAILDGNVKRVLCRHFGLSGYPGEPSMTKELWRLAESLLPPRAVGTYIQAQMDLGATVCTRTKPRCDTCPLAKTCVALRQGLVGQLPEGRPRKALPSRETRVLLLLDAGRVLLHCRPPSGIWGGLMSLPELPQEAQPIAYAASVLGCAVDSFSALAPVRHNFTHFHLTLRPLLGRARLLPRSAEPCGERWLSRDELSAAALPAPIRKLLEAALQAPDSSR
ncbi:A/G-specific adenine glycosylase [mine drainage metagenome]|uniref:Adenine DNA glycosylase n=1 Tax=mine drainage metagenome TaxID=410659 RepID=A0A1J5S4I5_9ZZZZ